MRKEESQFITKCISEAGSFSKNRDFTGFVNLDNYSCWVVADGLDSSDEKLSAELAATSIIEEFTLKPGFSKRLLKKYMKIAHSTLKELTGKSQLNASIMIVISDYNKIIHGHLGNSRLYHLRKDKLINKTRDHSISELISDLGELDKENINEHKYRNTLYNYLGKDGNIKIDISDKVKLHNDDVILLGTSGMWENLDEKDLGDILKGSMDSDEFVENIEYLVKENGSKNLNNYSIMSVFAENVFDYKEDKIRKKAADKGAKKFNFDFVKSKIFKRIMLFLLIAFMASGALLVKNHFGKINEKKQEEKAVKEQAEIAEKEASKLVNGGNYADSLSNLEDAKEKYKDNPEKLKEIDEKIKKIKAAMSAQDLELAGDKNYETKNYEGALNQYTQALNIMQTAQTGSTTALQDKLNNTKETIKLLDLEKTGDEALTKQDVNGALKIYDGILSSTQPDKFPEIIERIKSKKESLNQIEGAMGLETSGLGFYKKGKYDQALSKYNSALVIYQTTGMTQKQKDIKKTIQEIEELQISEESLKEGKTLENEGDSLLESKNYDKAKAKYEEALDKYDSGESQKDVNKVSKKIDSIDGLKKYDSAKAIETEGDKLFEDKKYKKAIEKYKESGAIYNDLDKPNECGVLDDKIAKAKKKDKVLGIF